MDKPSVAYIYQHAKWVVDSKGSYRYWFEYDEEWFDAVYEQAANLMYVIEYLVSKGLIDASDLDLPETSKETPTMRESSMTSTATRPLPQTRVAVSSSQ